MSNSKYLVPLAVVVAGLLGGCGGKAREELLPNQVAGIYLVKVEKNDLAKKGLTGMHHNFDFADYESVIGTYWDGDNKVEVYLTIFDSIEKASE